MHRYIYKIFLPLFFCSIISFNVYANGEEEVELAHIMASMQYFFHKTGLAVNSGNHELIEFYAHELEEIIEKVEHVESYDGFPIGKLTKKILLPVFEEFEAKIAAGDRDGIKSSFNNLIGSCNKCHESTGHKFIKIENNETNPYMQRFE